jgi:Fe-S cluster biogenesis protein NfuA
MYAEVTPNPLALKFVLGTKVVPQGSYVLSSLVEARGVPALEDLLSLPGVTGVVLTPEFMTVSKTEAVPWPLLESVIMSILQHHLASFPLIIQPADVELAALSDDWHDWKPSSVEEERLVQDIEGLIDSMIRPAVEADGGIITLCGVRDGVVFVRLQGACASCPHSQETLKGGVEHTLTHMLPEVRAVELVSG